VSVFLSMHDTLRHDLCSENDNSVKSVIHVCDPASTAG
jgi:hypothetical protein